MKADKVMVTIVVETLSIDSVAGMLADMVEQLRREVESGKLVMADGDSVLWDVSRRRVEF